MAVECALLTIIFSHTLSKLPDGADRHFKSELLKTPVISEKQRKIKKMANRKF